MAAARLVFVLAMLPFSAYGQPIVGPARVIDGDSLEVAGVRIRLFGIDAPEMKQTCEWPDKTIPCGNMAKLAMMDLLGRLLLRRIGLLEEDDF